MLLTGRSLRTIKHLTLSLPRPTYIHYGIPARIFQTSRLRQHPTPEDEVMFEEASDFDTGTASLFVPAGRDLGNEEPAVLLQFLNRGTGGTGATVNFPIIPEGDAISAYLALRNSPPALPQLRAEAYDTISMQAGSESLQQVMGMLADNVLEHFPRETDPEGFSKAIIAILAHATSQCPLSNQRILQLYEALVISHKAVPPPLHPEIVQRIATAALMRPEAAIPPLDTLGPTLLSSDPRTNDELKKSTQLSYDILMKVMLEGEEAYPRVLHLFEEMIKANRIPKMAQTRAGEQGGTFRTVVTSAIVRACIWYRWNGTAADALMGILRNPQWTSANSITQKDVQIISSLSVEVLRTLIPSMKDDDIKKARALIMALVPITSNDPHRSQQPPLDIPEDIIISFYESCFSCKLIEPAAHVYKHLQSPQISQYYEYPPPRREALLWLLHHLASPGVSSDPQKRGNLEGHLYLARAMLKDMVRRKLPVSPMDRPRLVALAAASGFGLLARQLWEMYTTADDPDRDIVRGNGHMLVRMVGLFVVAQERWDTEGERKKAKGKNLRRPHAPSNNTAPPGSNQDNSDYRPRDYRQFAEKVVASYIETKTPLARASHTDLSALARAQFLLGHLPEGIHTLSVIIERGDSPEVLDINVALAGLAYYSPTRAAEMIQYMLGRGVQPSAATFSTVLHEALKDKDTELIETLITRANNLGYGSLTQKGLASLLRQTMAFDYTSNKEERTKQQWSVRWAMSTVKTIMRHRSPDMQNYHLQDHAISVSVGLECVRGSLKAMQPRMAFEFWRLLVLDRVLWDDREHKDLRAWIARSIRHQWRERYLGTDKAMDILRELQAPGVEADGPQIGVSCPRRRLVDKSLDGDPGA